MIQIVKTLALAVGASLVLAATAQGNEEAYPSRPVRLVVGLAAGGPSDLLARTIAGGLQTRLGQTVVVENRVGAGGIVAASEVARAPADGYTIQFAAMPAVVFVPFLNEKLPYNQDKDFTPIGTLASYSLFLLAGPAMPANSVADVIKLAREKPGQLTYASGGVGTSNHLSGELLRSMAEIDIRHVPYKGNAPAYQDLLSGRVSMMFDFLSTSQQFVKAGKLRMIGTTGKQRSSFAPDVPSMDEQGLKGFDITAWFGLFVRSGTPQPVVDKLNAALRSTLEMPEIRSKLQEQGYEVTASTPQELATRIKSDVQLWGPIIRKAGIKTE
ncbi:tripartite tricarboxylate transporter substrate binding protein [Ramlibacter sp. AW1]|uniref:Tripartite tricarboxylate transporter substrate binding protein n=1 Tax=Ramlibacter aurantiacus TaxID=2801330 RepID=A0A936ZKN3_9BURK|nr:tripartite tricarboxylate transporter substrate binding protein [Ramlibacter aurantiacus]MBL0419043.1 tripartite tricarboxylate transporter substrate binding protein [Ramlibacter aurantiacus]